jgi:hypothetical protein
MSTCFKGDLPVFVNPCGWPAGITNLSPAPTPRGFHAIVERGLTFQNDDHLVVEVLVQRGALRLAASMRRNVIETSCSSATNSCAMSFHGRLSLLTTVMTMEVSLVPLNENEPHALHLS